MCSAQKEAVEVIDVSEINIDKKLRIIEMKPLKLESWASIRMEDWSEEEEHFHPMWQSAL